MIQTANFKHAVIAIMAALAVTAITPALGRAADPNLEQGIAMVNKGEFKKAIPLLRKAVEATPDNPEATFYLGVALNRTSGGKEAESLLKQSLMEIPDNPALNYELGLHYYNKDVAAEASDYFEQTQLLAPGSAFATKASALMLKIAEGKPEKNWELSVNAGGQYDSNVIINGRSMPTPAGYSGESDFGSILTLRGSYIPVRNQDLEAGIHYNFYQNIHAKLRQFDITQNQIELSAATPITQELKLKGSYTFEHLMLDSKAYDTAHTISPSLALTTPLGTTTFDYRYRVTDFKNSLRFPANSDRNGENIMVGMSQIIPINEDVACWIVYNRDTDRTNKSEWNYNGNRLMVGTRLPLPLEMTVDLSAEAYNKKYGARDAAYNNLRRNETQYTGSVTLTKNFTPEYSISLGETFSTTNSNIPDFTYNRSITTLLLSARF